MPPSAPGLIDRDELRALAILGCIILLFVLLSRLRSFVHGSRRPRRRRVWLPLYDSPERQPLISDVERATVAATVVIRQ
ncbi:hypothetical protein EXIGLDRAFT_722610 [Exidia glandulosa HHB12029]|uniref:Uncharacterized protein n=1 Tax=Exidia glandulosa HHB12029 TaxID=1314781 RepID=A0A165F8G6_EXIGL|nr:hypothetical protein EXIGLDRAFT_722610 [Exidia glandulosa HHB12029]